MEKRYYLDSCIWLNLFKKEGNVLMGVPYWKIAFDFIENIKANGGQIYVSTIVLKELYYILRDKFQKVKDYFKQTSFIEIVKTKNEDYNLARRYENQEGSKISFYDYLHIAIVKRLGCNLITRDNDLIKFAKNKILVNKPEELIS